MTFGFTVRDFLSDIAVEDAPYGGTTHIVGDLGMTGNGGFLLALGAAAGVHVAAFGLLPALMGGDSAGGGGAQEISVSIAGDAVAAMVADWERVPEAAETVAPMVMPSASIAPEVDGTAGAPMRTASPLPLPAVASTNTPAMQAQAPRIAPPVVENAPWVPSEPDTQATRKVAALVAPAETALPRVDTTAPKVPDFALQTSTRPAPRSAPSVTTRAAGRGDSATSGTGAADAPRATASRQATAAAEAAWAAAIQRQIARAQVYPRGARGDGRVRLAMTVTAGGRLAGVQVVQSSGVAAFDKAAVRAAKRAAPFPAAPDVLRDDRFAFGQWVAFRR